MKSRPSAPKHVLERLRKEVNFGCPVEGCGSPYLWYHHFDPPWREKHHYNPEGMIALCPTHAGHADMGLWTKDQLRDMKKKPYIKLGEVKDVYSYLRKDVVCDAGIIAYDFHTIFEFYGEKAIWFEKDEDGYNRLNLLIRDAKKNSILVMENNIWTVYSKDIFDLICSANGRELEIISKDKFTNLKIRYNDYFLKDFINYLSGNMPDDYINDLLKTMEHPKIVHVLKLRGKLLWGDYYIKISDFKWEDLITHSVIWNGLFKKTEIVIRMK
jgi:hypothetical protein